MSDVNDVSFSSSSFFLQFPTTPMSAIPVEKRALLVENAAKIVAAGKGILAADERYLPPSNIY